MPATVICYDVLGSDALDVTLFAEGSDTPIDAGDFTRRTNDAIAGTFSATGLSGLHRIVLKTASGAERWTGWVVLASSGTLEAQDSPHAARMATMVAPDGAIWKFSANALEESPSGGTIQNNVVVPRAIATAVTKPDQIAIIRGDLVTFSLDELGDLSTRTKLWFTAKRKHADADSDAVIQIEEAGGLLRLLGVAPSSSSLASIVVTDEDAGEIVITLKGEATKLLSPADAGVWDVQWLPSGGNGPKTPRSGTHTITSDVTRATS